MNIAVTGATGFVGRYLARHLQAAGHTLRLWYRPAAERAALPDFGAGVDWIAGELGDDAAGRDLVAGTDAVVHAAVWVPGERFQGGEGDLVEFVETNVLGTLRLARAAQQAGVGRFVFISSCAVHDVILADRPLDEAHPLWPRSHYGAHKAAIEKFVHSLGLGEGYPICSLRPTGVYGLAEPPAASKWFDLVRDIVHGKSVLCRKGGKEVHAADVSRAVSVLLQAPEDAIRGQAFSCYDRYISEYDVAALARRLSGSQADVQGAQTRPQHEIENRKLRELGMQFGGSDLLERTVGELVGAVRHLDLEQ